MKSVEEWKSALRAALKEAMRARQSANVAVLRETLAAIDNAEAADVSSAPPVEQGVIAGGVAGLGAGEVARRSLTPQDVLAIIDRELRERREAAASYARLGQREEAEKLSMQAEVLARFL